MKHLLFNILTMAFCMLMAGGTLVLAYWLSGRDSAVTARRFFNRLLPLVAMQLIPVLLLVSLSNLHLILLDFGAILPFVFYYALVLIYALPVVGLIWLILTISHFIKSRR